MTTLSTLVNQTVNPTYTFRNKVRNGAMLVDQRGTAAAAIATTTAQNTYTLDGWVVSVGNAGTGTGAVSTQQVADGPAGFTKSLKMTLTATNGTPAAGSYNMIYQPIEGLEMLGSSFGTASAQSLALSFWVKSSLTGTFAVALHNGGLTRSYVTTYTVSAANTWQQVKIIVPGDTTGTWAFDSTTGIAVKFTVSAGSTYQTSTLNAWQAGNLLTTSSATNWAGTASSTFQVTGVQLEINTAATPFEYNWYPTELARNQRYFFKITGTTIGYAIDATRPSSFITFPTTMRVGPTVSSGTFTVSTGNAGTVATANANINNCKVYNGANNWTSFVDLDLSASFSAEI